MNRSTTTSYWADGRTKDVVDPSGSDTHYDTDFVNKEETTTDAYGTGPAETSTQVFDGIGATTTRTS